MLPQWIIEKKRDGSELDTSEIHKFIQGYTKGDIPDYQMAALAMAIYFNGMTPRETADLTHAMMHSGNVINPASIPGTKVDKHSTGGIGDKISIPLAPLVAASGATVPMISGRGLGITGGTLDKLEAIPGYRTNLTQNEFFQTLETCRCSMIGQTPEIAPADKKLYALRDVTATVPSIPLIVSSIMSKKLAEGIDALVLDVKCGTGAFMKNIDDARALAQALVDTGKAMDKKITALITDMNQPLGRTVGNALEIRESLEILNGKGPEDTQTLTLELAKQMLHVAEIRDLGKEIQHVAGVHDLGKEIQHAAEVRDLGKGIQHVAEVRDLGDKVKDPALHLKDGSAMQKFKQMVQCHGGDLSAPLPTAENQIELPAPQSGYISKCDAETIGRASLLLGAGRTKTADTIDPAVGISNLRKIGEPIKKGQPLCIIHSNSHENPQQLFQLLETAFSISPSPQIPPPLILETISA